jgi:hypothetical protein
MICAMPAFIAPSRLYRFNLALIVATAAFASAQTPSAPPTTLQPPSLLVDIDHRPSVSLDGAWHYIVDPYRNGWGDNPDQPRLNGFAKERPFQRHRSARIRLRDLAGAAGAGRLEFAA